MLFQYRISRRNITDDKKVYLIEKRYQEEKKEEGRPKLENKPPHSEEVKPTAYKIAEQHNVSHATVKRAEKFANAVDKVAEMLV
jgi:hypothetical protein